MCTITLSYDQNNALARRKLAAFDHKEPTQEEIDSYRQERDIFMDHSKKSMANVIARYL